MFYFRVRGADVSDERRPKPNWRPWTLSTPFLSFFISLCICLFIGNEVTRSGCAKWGCHVFGQSSNGNLPSVSRFLYTQFPTALSVALGLVWILPHHDICRLEPYFRMSAEGGENAGASLFLKYQYQTVALVPFIALNAKHYEVALSSSILLLMNFLIAPFVSGIFEPTVVINLSTGNATLLSFDVPGQNISGNPSFMAYNYAWRDGTLPPFMTDTFALLPLRADEHNFISSENWTVETTLFEAEFNCHEGGYSPAQYYHNAFIVDITSQDNQHFRLCDAGAVAQNPTASKNDTCNAWSGFITPWASTADQILIKNQPVMYIYTWATGLSSLPNVTHNFTFPGPVNMTALFCTPEYYSQTVDVSFQMPAGRVLNVTRTGKPKPMPTLPGFDRILDGNAVESGPANETLNLYANVAIPVRFGYQATITADYGPDLISKFGQCRAPITSVHLGRASQSNVYAATTDSLDSFSLFNMATANLTELLDIRTLENTLETGLKMLFAFAMAEVVGSSTTSTRVPVEQNAYVNMVIVNTYWSAAARIGLLVIIVLASLLLFLIRRRPCELYGDPSSMAASLRLLSASPSLSAAMRYSEFYNPKLLALMMDSDQLHFKLKMDTVNRTFSTIEVTQDPAGNIQNQDQSFLPHPGQTVPAMTQKPWVVASSRILSYFSPCFAASLIILFAWSKSHDGFPILTDPNSFQSRVLLIYLPYAAAAVVENFLIDLGVKQCMMGPYKALEKGKASYSKSLAVAYTKYPPHFQLHSALFNRGYTVPAISLAILLSKVLAVAVVGLLPINMEAPRTPRTHKIVHPFVFARQDMYFQLGNTLANISNVSWTTPDLYIDPPYKVVPLGNNDHKTVGFGINVTCTPVSEDRILFPCSPQYNSSHSVCPVHGLTPLLNLMLVIDPCGTGNSNSSETYWDGFCAGNLISCPDRIIPIWVQNKRFHLVPPGSTTRPQPGVKDLYEFVALNCSLSDKIVDVTAKVRDGEFMSATNARPMDNQRAATYYPNETSFNANFLSESFADVLGKSIIIEGPILQNQSMARINNLMTRLNPSVINEPSNITHLPNSTLAAAVFEQVIQRMFPLLLEASVDDVFADGPISVAGDVFPYRVHVNPIIFAISLVIVLFSCGLIIAVYFGQDLDVQGHIPWSLAEMYSQLYASNIKRDMSLVTEMSDEGIERDNKELKRRYGYGRYPEQDQGVHHFGIYREDPKDATEGGAQLENTRGLEAGDV